MRQYILAPGARINEFRTNLESGIHLNPQIDSAADVEDAIAMFMRNITLAALSATPEYVRHTRQHPQYMLTPNAAALLRMKRRLRKEYVRTGDIRVHQTKESPIAYKNSSLKSSNAVLIKCCKMLAQMFLLNTPFGSTQVVLKQVRRL